MDLDDLRASLNEDAPPADLTPPLLALWLAATGEWNAAHDCAQSQKDSIGARIHAYLHRVEGDLANARYWYDRADVTPFEGSLAEEWEALTREFLPGVSRVNGQKN